MITFCNKKLKYCTDPIKRGNPPSYVEDSGIIVINQSCVWPSGLDMSKAKQHNPKDTNRIDAWLREDDILINSTGTGTLGRICHINATIEKPFFADGHITILRDSKERISLRFLFYLLSIRQEHITVECSEGATNQIELNRSLLGNLKISWPKLNYQNTIANYLDRKTAEIDRLIAAKKNLLSLLDEKKQALIAHAVTRGLDPDVGLKDSGIPWLGLIPEHWEPKPLKRLFKYVKRQNHPSHEVLSVYRDYGVIKKSSRDDNNNKTPEDLSVYQLVEKGDLVINKMKAWQGSLGVSDYFGITSPDYVVYRAVHSENDRFLHHSLRSPFMPSVYGSISNGIRPSQWRIEPNKFEQLLFFFPPKKEQERIVKYIDSALEKMDKLSSSLTQSITLLQERRGALISAAVTGKIDQEDLDAD